MTEPKFQKIFDISTAHLKIESLRFLSQVCRFEDEYGFLVSTYSIENENCPEEVRNILVYAEKLGADYVMFDADGERYEQFREFDW